LLDEGLDFDVALSGLRRVRAEAWPALAELWRELSRTRNHGQTRWTLERLLASTGSPAIEPFVEGFGGYTRRTWERAQRGVAAPRCTMYGLPQ
jgi:hypothetical protein